MTLRHSVVRQTMLRVLRDGAQSPRHMRKLVPLRSIPKDTHAEFCLRELQALCALGFVRIHTVDPDDNLNTTYALR